MTTTIDEPLLVQSQAGGVLTLTLNRPRAFNSLSEGLLRALLDEVARVDERAEVRVLVVKGNGKAFCAGHDLSEMGANRNRSDLARLFGLCSELMLKLARTGVPVVAVVDGIATAAGCQLVAACDLALASERSRFATSGVKYGLFCATPMVALSRAVPRKPALEMLLTGDFIDAQTALGHGLVNQVVAHDKLDGALDALLGRLLDKPKEVLAVGKRAFYGQLEMGLEDAYALATDVIVDNALTDDFAEGLAAFEAKRAPTWRK